MTKFEKFVLRALVVLLGFAIYGRVNLSTVDLIDEIREELRI